MTKGQFVLARSTARGISMHTEFIVFRTELRSGILAQERASNGTVELRREHVLCLRIESSASRQGRTVSQMVWGGAPLAVTGLANIGKTWPFLDFLNLIVKIEGAFIQA